MNGFIVIDRKLLEWKYAQFPYAVALWIHILLKANWKDGYFLGELIPRGSFATSMQNLAAETGMDVHTVRKWLKRFEKDNQIELKSTNRFTIIKVLNYSTYQNIPDEGYSKQDSEPNSKQSSKRDSNNLTKKQSNNIPPLYSPRGKRAKNHERVVIDTPEWYRKQQNGEANEKREIDEDLIREIEELKETMTGKEDNE